MSDDREVADVRRCVRSHTSSGFRTIRRFVRALKDVDAGHSLECHVHRRAAPAGLASEITSEVIDARQGGKRARVAGEPFSKEKAAELNPPLTLSEEEVLQINDADDVFARHGAKRAAVHAVVPVVAQDIVMV